MNELEKIMQEAIIKRLTIIKLPDGTTKKEVSDVIQLLSSKMPLIGLSNWYYSERDFILNISYNLTGANKGAGAIHAYSFICAALGFITECVGIPMALAGGVIRNAVLDNDRSPIDNNKKPTAACLQSYYPKAKNKDNSKFVYSSVFAPNEVAPKQHMIVQVYLHLPKDTDKIKELASETDKNAERRGYEPLEVKLKKGDSVEIELNINSDKLLYNCKKTVIWQGPFVKRTFDYIVPNNLKVCELGCQVNIFVNGAIAGEMIFTTKLVNAPRRLNTKVIAKPTKKLFISYSHKDLKAAEKIARIHEALGIDVFFDKHRLKSGYIYSEEISKFIQSADTFVLCWSQNAAKSDYVEKERQEALALAYPRKKPRELASLRIYPYNIKPHAIPPKDMIEDYYFEEL